MITFTTNANEVAMKYERRVQAMMRISNKPREFALALHQLREVNLDKLIYNKSPYRGTKNAPKGDLKSGERVIGDSVFNVSPHAETRRRMHGTYKIAPGLSKEADWERISFMEVIPIVQKIERTMNYSVIRG